MAHNASANDHTMVPNVAPDSSPQPQTVLQQLWEQQQSAQYYSYWMPERVSQIPAHNMSAEQSCRAYPSSTYYKKQPMQPVPQSAQCGSSSNWSYPTHAMLVCPFSLMNWTLIHAERRINIRTRIRLTIRMLRLCLRTRHLNTEHAQQASSQGRDNYRPTYTDSSPRYDRSTNPYHQYPRRVLVAGKAGPAGKSRGP
jgi:hypothetical protein